MADSRLASNIRMRRMKRVVESQTRIIYFLSSILLSLLVTNLIRTPDYTTAQVYVLFLICFAILLWVTEAIPPFAVGIMIVGYLVFFLGNPTISDDQQINVKAFVNTWSDSVIWLLLGGFFLAEAMKKTGLDMDLFKITASRFWGKPNQLLLSLMFSTALASMFMSNTATTAMMLAAVMPLLNREDADSNFKYALLLGIPVAATLGGMGTIIGSPPNVIAVDMINNMPNINVEIGFLEWMYFGVPIAIVLILLFWRILVKKFPLSNLKFDISELLKPAEEVSPEFEKEHRLRKKIVLVLLLVTVFLWMTDKLHPIPMAAVSGIPIIGLTMLSIITNEDVRRLPWDTLMLVAGGLSLGLAMQQTGLSDQFVKGIQTDSLPPYILISVFAIATVFFSNIMSNTATVSILVPAAVLVSGIEPLVLPLIIGLCGSCALFLPVSTPPNAIAFSTGLLKQSDFRLAGLIIGLGGPLLIIFWVLLLT